jgi:hypothetical protein
MVKIIQEFKAFIKAKKERAKINKSKSKALSKFFMG